MLYIGTPEEEKEYRDAPGLPQSTLKKLGGALSEYRKELDPNADFIRIGKAVDAMITGTKESFSKQFYVLSSDKNPSDSIRNVIKTVYEEVKDEYDKYLEESDEAVKDEFRVYAADLDYYHHYIVHACEQENYGQSYKLETRLKKVIEWSDYFRSLVESEGKIKLSKDEYQRCKDIVHSLKTNERTSKYFNLEFFDNNPDVDIYYQLPIFFEYEDIACKALLDIVIVEKEDDKVVKVTPIDLKTLSGDTFQFSTSFRVRRYDIQAYWYSLAIEHHFGIKPEPFIFVVESTTDIGKPLDFEVTEEAMQTTKEGVKYYPGVDELLNRYRFYQEHGFSLEKEIVESKGRPLKIQFDGIQPREEDGSW